MTEKDFFEKAVVEAGWEPGLITPLKLVEESEKESITPFKRYLANEAFNQSNKKLTSDAIYFSGEHPVIHFKQLKSFDGFLIKELHRKLWNEGRSPFLIVVTSGEITVFDCYNKPVEKVEDLDKLTLGKPYKSNVPGDLERLANYLGQAQIDSGKIWSEKGIGNQLHTKNRVDKLLLDNLIETRKKLLKKRIPERVIHDLLGRNLFILYLEDRKVLTPKYFPEKPKNVTVNDYFDLLDYPKSVYRLFNALSKKFNGDLFPISEQEEQLDDELLKYALTEIKACFYGTNQRTGQLTFWKQFAFEYIPLELISAIYEEFMSGTEDGSEKAKKAGAFYTPHMLVEFILNEVLPWPDENDSRYDLKILDPTCGSGIFLVESYRRLIERYLYAKSTKKIPVNKLQEILLNSIHGIESNPEAIKVAAFSLYLVFLHYLTPKEIWGNWNFEPLVKWTDEDEVTERLKKRKKLGNNLFQCDTFSDGDFKKIKYDLVVGNPPWLRDPSGEIKKYIEERALPSEAAVAFLDYVPQIAPKATIALVCSAKVLFNSDQKDKKFIRDFFSENSVEEVINLSLLRQILFKNAVAPASILVYSKGKDKQKETIIYCVPKNKDVINSKRAIIIDSTELKYLPLREIINNPGLTFKVGMWGGIRDLKLITRLQKTTRLCDIETCEMADGLHSKEKDKPLADASFKSHYWVPSKPFPSRYAITIADGNIKKIGKNHENFRANTRDIFKPPVVILKETFKNLRFCASYVDFDCGYPDSISGITIRAKNEDFHKALAAFLNSSIVTYYLFNTSSSWTIERERINTSELKAIPALILDMKLSDIKQLAELIDEMNIFLATPLLSKDLIKEKEKELDERVDAVIYKALDLPEYAKSLIEDCKKFSIGLFHQGFKTGAFDKCKKSEIKNYSEVLKENITRTLKYSKKGAWAEIYPTSKEQLNVIAIHYADLKVAADKGVVESDLDIQKQLRKINEKISEEYNESIYYRRVVRFHTKNTTYVIKPNEKRFWNISQALNDADSILADLINISK